MNEKFWDGQAKKYKDSVTAVNFDPLMEELERHFIEKFMRNNESVCDLGCGNGLTLLELAKKFPASVFYGVDSSAEMIKVAEDKKRASSLKNIHFYTADAAGKNMRRIFDFRFDKILTKRLLINLKGRKKAKAVQNIHFLLKKRGMYIMIECFLEPLQKINGLRKGLELEEIKVKSFNEYLTSGVFNNITKGYFSAVEELDFGSLYYFTSRIYNAWLSKGKPDYFSEINKLAVEVTKYKPEDKIVQGYSPEKMIILRKV